MWRLTSTAGFTHPDNSYLLLVRRVQTADVKALIEGGRRPLRHTMTSRSASAASVTSSTGRVSTMPTLK